MTEKDNILKAIRFERPEYIPMQFVINASCWHHYDHEELYGLMESHKLLFPDFKRPADPYQPEFLLNARESEPYTDPWGCLWLTNDDGITGAVHGHPLDDWEKLQDYKAPDPAHTDGTYPIDWDEITEDVRVRKEKGEIVIGGLPHGHTFLRLQDIRGYENLLFDMVDEHPDLKKLIDMVEEFNYGYVRRWMELDPDIMMYPEDLGMQVGPMLSPDQFRKYIKPSYQRFMNIAREQGTIVHMHSDGDIRLLVDDLIDGGVDVINLQDQVNGIDWIAGRFRGNTAVELDIDRQHVTYSGTPKDIDALIRHEVSIIGTKEGGLLMIYGLYPGVPIENAKALMDAMERYAGYFS